jgi:arsenate reductase
MAHRVLFVCEGNRARSQMAEGLLRQLGGRRFEVYSAGIRPKGLAPQTVEVMQEIGIDVSGQVSQRVEEFAGETFDHVIIVCSVVNREYPSLAGGGERLFWDVEDPSAGVARGLSLMDAMRASRDDLRARIEAFVARQPPAAQE